MSGQLSALHGRFAHHFIGRTRNVIAVSKRYLCGLFQADKKNMERMAEKVPEVDDQELQHFVTNSPWSHRGVLDQVAVEADRIVGGGEDSGLFIDESGFEKKGRDSAGVARQWNGRRGKVDNCQVGVFAALARGTDVTLVDCELYLPQEWTQDAERCEKAGIPREERGFRSKAQRALGMVRRARGLGLRFGYVGLDGGYGKEPWLLRSLDDEGEVFLADIHRDQMIYLENPRPGVPERRSRRGRAPSRPVAQSEGIRVDQWAVGEGPQKWSRVTLRDGTKGALTVEVLHRQVWLWDGQEAQARKWRLLVRRELGAQKEIKYALSNAPMQTSTERVAQMQAQRYWIEHALRNGKSEAGMADYQVRKWQSWYHHMAMVLLGMLFMLEVRVENREAIPLLSCHDVVEVLKVVLPRRDATYEEIFRQVVERHRRRLAAIDSAKRRQRE